MLVIITCILFFRVEIENTADKGSESFHPAPTGLDKCWLIKYSGLLKCTHNDISSYNFVMLLLYLSCTTSKGKGKVHPRGHEGPEGE